MHGLKFTALTAALAIPCFITGQAHAKSQIILFGVVDDGVVHTYQKKMTKAKRRSKTLLNFVPAFTAGHAGASKEPRI